MAKTNSYRIVIYGAGAVGCMVGGLLAHSGTHVLLIGRPGNVNAIREHGLRLVRPDRTYIVRLPTVNTPNQIKETDVVFLCVKSQDTERAIRDLYTTVKDVPIFCFQNGVRNEEIVSKYFPRVYGVMVKSGAVFIHDGEVASRGDPPGRFVIGCYSEGTDKLVESIATTLREAGFGAIATPEIMLYKWGKLLENLKNAVGAITNSAGEEANRIAQATQNEGEEILAHAGVRWIQSEEMLLLPKDANQPDNDLPSTYLGSTWQSLTRHQGTVETEFLNGEIVRVAQKMGKRAPINETLLRITEKMAFNHEPPGKYTPAELIKILNLS